MRQQQAALQAGHPQVPGAIAIGAPPPPQHIPPQANMAQVMQYHQHPQEPEADAYPVARGQMGMIQKARRSRRSQKTITRNVNMAEMSPPATPEYLKGSETPITFSRVDHPPVVPRPGHSALVLEAQIGGSCVYLL